MENLGDDYMKSFFSKLGDFFELHCQWWLINKMNSQPEGYDTKEILYWWFIQNYAKQKIEVFAKNLPKEAKESFESELKEVEDAMEKIQMSK